MVKVNKLKFVFYGAGGIGATLGGWLSQNYENIYILARGDNAKAMKDNGLILYERENKNPEPIPVRIIEDLNELTSIDVVVIVVKNYDLKKVAKDIYSKLGDKPIIVALQNGVENQEILPKYFSKIIYGVVVQSGWYDKPGVFGNRGKGYIILGTLNNENQELLEKIAQIFNLGFTTRITKNYQEAAHSKLIVNLANSIFTLISSELGDDIAIFKLWQIFVNVFLEGVKVIKVAGYDEYELRGLPSWNMMKIGKNLDKKAAVNNIERSLEYSWLNSMAQDKIIRQKDQSELESLNGYILKLADSLNIEIPYNKIIYKLCKKQFKKMPYQPLPIEVVWEKINEALNKK